MTNATNPFLDYVRPGDDIDILISVTNSGKLAQDVTVVDALTDMLSYIKDPKANGLTVKVNDVVKQTTTVEDLMDGLDALHLLPGQVLTLSFKVGVKDDLKFKDVVTMTNLALVNEVEVTDDIDLKTADIVAEKTGFDHNRDGYVQDGERLTYHIVVSNEGNQKAEVFIKDDLKDLKDLVTYDGSQKLMIDGKESVHTLDDLIKGIMFTLDLDAEITITFTVDVLEDLDFTKTMTFRNIAHVDEKEIEVTIENEIKEIPVVPVPPVVPKENLPKTGVSDNSSLMMSLAMIALGGLILITLAYRKEEWS